MRRSIFLAYSWDKLTTDFYNKITDRFKNDWDIRCGINSITMPPMTGDIEKFRNQNKQLFERFVSNIKTSDVFIADITQQNPNVMLELGIAINLNKNILILSGIPAAKIPFDITGIQIEFYQSLTDVENKIKEYLNTFLGIKNLGFKQKNNGSYYFLKQGIIETSKEAIRDGSPMGSVYRISPIPLQLPRMKDTKLRVKYKITNYSNPSDWFGFMLRASENKGRFEPITRGAILINARVNGNTDITMYPGEYIPKTLHTHMKHDRLNFRTLEITLDNTHVKVKGEEGELEYNDIELVNFGYIYLACFRCAVSFKNLEVINTDTISEIV